MEGKIVIRKLRKSDEMALIRNYFLCYDEVKRHPNFGVMLFKKKPLWNDEKSWFKELYANFLKGNAIVFVAQVGKEAIGLCEISGNGVLENSHIGIFGILVAQRYRGKGIGMALMKATLNDAKKRFEMVKLGVFSNNATAIRAYRKLGFKNYGKIPRAIKRNERYIDETLMYLRL